MKADAWLPVREIRLPVTICPDDVISGAARALEPSGDGRGPRFASPMPPMPQRSIVQPRTVMAVWAPPVGAFCVLMTAEIALPDTLLTDTFSCEHPQLLSAKGRGGRGRTAGASGENRVVAWRSAPRNVV